MADVRLKRTLVLDVGSGNVKAGFAGEEAPRVTFPSVVGRPKTANVMAASPTQECYVGDEARSMRGILRIEYALQHGIVQDWDDMEKIWSHAFFNELRIDPREHPVMLTEPALNPKSNRERMTQVMFDTFFVPAIYVSTQAILSLYAAGRTTGIVCDSGDGVTHIVPVYEGYAMPHAILRMNLAGRDLNEHLLKLLSERGSSLTSSAEREIVRDIKEKCCYVAEDFEKEMQRSEGENFDDTTYELPDGNLVALGSERFRCPEAMFNPPLVGKEAEGVHKMIFQSIVLCDVDLRRELFQNIVLSGGTTLFKGFGKRIQTELAAMAPASLRIRVLNPEDRAHSVFIGGSMLSDLDVFTDMCVSRAEYKENGPSVIHSKCF